MTEAYDSTTDTREHIRRVRQHLAAFRLELLRRGIVHDESKLASPEKEVFDAVTPKLAELTYGSEEYKAALAEMGEALTHHYANNSHHPEHYVGGVADMDLFDIIEMFADWKAASERHAGGDFARSLEINRERFGISDQLAQIFENTRQRLGW